MIAPDSHMTSPFNSSVGSCPLGFFSKCSCPLNSSWPEAQHELGADLLRNGQQPQPLQSCPDAENCLTDE